MPYEKVVDEMVETIVEKPVYEDHIFEVRESQVDNYEADGYLPTETWYEEQEVIVEKPVVRENVIRRDVEVPVEYIKEVHVENIIEKQVEQIV